MWKPVAGKVVEVLDKVTSPKGPGYMLMVGLSASVAWVACLFDGKHLVQPTDPALGGMAILFGDAGWTVVWSASFVFGVIALARDTGTTKAFALLWYVIVLEVSGFLILIAARRPTGLMHVLIGVIIFAAFIRQIMDTVSTKRLEELAKK